MYARGVAAKWQSRRKISLGGPVRRACPASGATWNVQIVRGKMTSRCLWHACRALALGLVLMVIGAGMATIGKSTSSQTFPIYMNKIPIFFSYLFKYSFQHSSMMRMHGNV